MAVRTAPVTRSTARTTHLDQIWRARHALWPESGAVSQIPALDGLRAVAALLVLLFHAWSMVPNYVAHGQDPAVYPLWYAKTGVHLFFVLSGFLLFLPYAQWLFGLRPRPAALMFYKRRALRVVPAYWASLVITVLIHGALLYDVLLHIVFLSNTTWESTFSINGVYWTMAIEVQFYAVLPLVGWVMYRLSKSFGLVAGIVATLLGLFAISMASTYVTHIGGLNLVSMPVTSSFLVQYSAMPYWLAVFGSGIACSILFTYVTRVLKPSAPLVQRKGTLANVAFAAGIVLAVLLSIIPALQNIWMQQVFFGIAYAGVLLGVLFGSPILRRPLESLAVRFVGLISYSFYIWHHAVLVVLAPRIHGWAFQNHTIVLFLLGLICTLPIAYVSYLCFERPFMKARKKSHEKLAQA